MIVYLAFKIMKESSTKFHSGLNYRSQINTWAMKSSLKQTPGVFESEKQQENLKTT